MVVDSTLEYLVWKLISISIINLIKTEALLCKNFRIMPMDIEVLPYWQYELFVKNISDLVSEENKKYENEKNKYTKAIPKLPSRLSSILPSGSSEFQIPALPQI